MVPRVSILLPSYNHAEFLGECLQSVLSQTFEDWELIAIDDRSTDRSFELLQEQSDRRIAVHVNPQNLGTYGTLDRALGLAQGEYVAILNSDDSWSPEKLALQTELLDGNPNVQLCYTSGRPVSQDGTKHEPPTEKAGWPTEPIQDLLPFLLSENHVLASSVMFRRQFARFRPELRYSGDWVALLTPSRNAPVGLVAGDRTFWRQHAHNTYRRSPGQVQEEVLVRESILSQAPFWEVPRVPGSAVRRGLSDCARHLSALYVLQGRMTEARQVARAAVRLKPGSQSLRRLAIVSLSPEAARKRLWGSEQMRPTEEGRVLISFP